MNKYGNRLKEIREKTGYTQQQLADILNTSRSRIGMYEQGRRQPDFETQEAIADLFNVSMDYLFSRNNPPAAGSFSPGQLSKDESELLNIYNQLNGIGKKEAKRYMSYLNSQDEYIKNTDSKLLDDAV